MMIRRPRRSALDSETTGLDRTRDRLITIGAVAVVGDEILLEDRFEVMMPIAYNASAVTVHGITRDEARDGARGLAPVSGLSPGWGGRRPPHRPRHCMLNSACRRHFGFDLKNRALDAMDLTLHFERAGAFPDYAEIRGFDLDTLCRLFAITPHDRHTAEATPS